MKTHSSDDRALDEAEIHAIEARYDDAWNRSDPDGLTFLVSGSP